MSSSPPDLYKNVLCAPDEYLEHEVAHYSQRYNWDCGVSCVMMVLGAAQREEFVNNFEKICNEEGFGHCTWTIDLCYLLKRFGIKHVMYSTMLGVNEAHRKHSYYQNILDQDRSRVSRRFDAGTAAGLELRPGLLSTAEIVAHLQRGPAIVLVDSGLLACDLCKHNKLKADFRRCFGGSFTGHFILVVGQAKGKVLYRDPALPARLCATTGLRLRRARAPPTDHDVLLLYNDYRR
ncbi:protein GUCD1 [Choristoneura fumiferana]|uniref:protein GUCD1 n=1 Tax=Choristoneura fumiferana TaxID=7141 RepID=UPI003D153B4D